MILRNALCFLFVVIVAFFISFLVYYLALIMLLALRLYCDIDLFHLNIITYSSYISLIVAGYIIGKMFCISPLLILLCYYIATRLIFVLLYNLKIDNMPIYYVLAEYHWRRWGTVNGLDLLFLMLGYILFVLGKRSVVKRDRI